ncbi:GntR family transcriptional regulator [Paenibacillus spongiae]|nr:GntR family transcriptional regulator [Paenibacillus spongiae]
MKIQDYIRELIQSENLAAGDRIPTEKELMERFNVSKITVVNALSALAAENMITRIRGKGSFVGFQPEETTEWQEPVIAAVPELEPEIEAENGRIGVILPFIHDFFAIRIITGIQNALRERGYRSLFMLSEGCVNKEKEAIQSMKEFGVKGMLIFPVDDQQYNEEILSMKLGRFPFVLIDRYLPGIETNYIASDGKQGIAMAVEHLWQLGHREIAICSDSPLQTVTVQERLDGYMEALKLKGALINPTHMITGFRLDNVNNSDHPLYRYIRSRLATAYITLNGELGIHIYKMAERAGLRVPEDLSIVTFDDPTSNVEEFSIFTHIKQFEKSMGYKAVVRLLEVIEGQDTKFTKELLEPQLVVCQTSGPNMKR